MAAYCSKKGKTTMRYAVTSSEMKQYDRNTSQIFGVQTEILEGLSQGDRVVTGTKLVSASGKMPDPKKMQQQPGGNNNPFMPRPPRDDNNNKRTE